MLFVFNAVIAIFVRAFYGFAVFRIYEICVALGASFARWHIPTVKIAVRIRRATVKYFARFACEFLSSRTAFGANARFFGNRFCVFTNLALQILAESSCFFHHFAAAFSALFGGNFFFDRSRLHTLGASEKFAVFA